MKKAKRSKAKPTNSKKHAINGRELKYIRIHFHKPYGFEIQSRNEWENDEKEKRK